MAGEYGDAETALREGMTRCRQRPDLAETPSPAGTPAGVNLAMNLSVVVTTRGDLDGGRRAAAERLALARRVGNPFMLAAALVYEAWRARLVGEVDAVLAAADEAMALATEFPFWLAWAAALRGWARARGGEVDDGLSAVRGSIAVLEGAGVRTVSPSLRAAEADALLRWGRREDGLDAVATGLAGSAVTGAHAWDADLLRLRGELELAGNGANLAAAEAALTQARDLARRQGAGLTEQRAAAALGRLGTTS
jgi:hypothetical protein